MKHIRQRIFFVLGGLLVVLGLGAVWLSRAFLAAPSANPPANASTPASPGTPGGQEKYVTQQGITMLRGQLTQAEGAPVVTLRVTTAHSGEFTFAVDPAVVPVFLFAPPQPYAVADPHGALADAARVHTSVQVAYREANPPQVLSVLLELPADLAAHYPTPTATPQATPATQGFATKPDWMPTPPPSPTGLFSTPPPSPTMLFTLTPVSLPPGAEATLAAEPTPTLLRGKLTAVTDLGNGKITFQLRGRPETYTIDLHDPVRAILPPVKIVIGDKPDQIIVPPDPLKALRTAQAMGLTVFIAVGNDGQLANGDTIAIMPGL